MSRDVITVGSTMRIPLLYRGEYSQWRERFMNYLEEQTDSEAMINSIQNGDQPLPVITQVSLARNEQNAPPTLKDPKFWIAEEKKTRKIDHFARSLLIQGLLNDIYSLIDRNETSKDLWDALERQTKNIMDINIDALYNILEQNQGDVNDALGYKKKAVVITLDPLALVAEKTKVSKLKEKVVVFLDSKGSDADDFSELKKITALLAKAFNRRKLYSKPTNNNLRTSSTSQSANKKQEFVKSDDKKFENKDDEKKLDMSKVKCYNCKKEGHFAKDCKKAKVKDYNYYKTKMLLAKKDSDEQVLLAEDQARMESSSDPDQEINANMVFMAQIKKVLSESDESSSSAEETIAEVAYYTSESESEFEFETSEYYDNSTNYGFFVNNDDDQEIFHDAVESANLDAFSSVRRPKESSVIWKRKGSSNTSNVDLSFTSCAYVCNDAMNVSCNSRLCDSFDENNLFIFDDESVRIYPVSKMPFKKKPRDYMYVRSKSNSNKSLPRTVHRWLPKMQLLAEPIAKWIPRIVQIYLWIIDSGYSKHMTSNRALLTNFVEKFLGTVRFGNNDFAVIAGYGDVVIGSMTIKKVYYVKGLGHNLFSVGQFCDKGLEVAFRKSTCFVRNEDSVDLLIGFENSSYFEKAKDLRPSLYDEKVIGLGYTAMFLIHSNEALEIEKFKRARENKIKKIIIDLEDEVVSLLEKEKSNLKTIESLKSKGFESSENAIFESKNQSEKECDQVENSKVIAPGMFKLSVSQSASPISMSKTCCDSKNVESKLKRKRRKRKSSKQNDKQVNNEVSRANSDFVHLLDLDTFSSVRRPKQSSVIWKKKGSSNTSNVDLSSVSHLKINKDVKRYSRKDLLSCNNSHLGETSSAYVCNDALNVFVNPRLCDLFDENNLFIFDDESVIISLVSKMPFRKKPCDSMNVRSKSNSNKSLPRTVHRWLPKMQSLVEPIAKWILRIVQIYLWIIDSECSKHMTGNRALLTNFVEKFLGTVRFGNNDFVVIAGYGDVVIGSIIINKVYYVEGL
nr:integrase, catalytic region, zinc finger, CCHC-type, peptidase aspartic, catalytic [Tanacetum cinerariifolium]